MNGIIASMCVGMLSSSIISLLISLRGTYKAYKKHNIAKEKIDKMKKDQEVKIDEIINTQKEIIKIIDSMENADKDLAIEVLKKAKKELEENYQHQKMNKKDS